MTRVRPEGHAKDRADRRIVLGSVPNLRDLGDLPTRDGGRVRPGRVYRSTDLSRLDDADREAFAALAIRTVYDLRTAAERELQPDRVPPSAAYVVVDVLADSASVTPATLQRLLADAAAAREALGDGRGVALFTGKYREFVSLPSARAGYRRLFLDLAGEAHWPALVHCTTGKDRTGWVVAALLALLDVPEEEVMEDYLMSGAALAGFFAPGLDEFRAGGGDPELLRPLIDVRPDYLDAAFAEMRRAYGTIRGYFADGLGIDAAAQERLRAALVEAPAARHGA